MLQTEVRGTSDASRKSTHVFYPWVWLLSFSISEDTGTEVLKNVLCSWFRVSQVYINKCPTRCNNMQSIFYCNITLHVSGAVHTHHQEYINCSYSYWDKSCVRAATSLQRGQVRTLLTWPCWSEVAA